MIPLAEPAIPDPPREVLWRPCLARRWVLGLLGGLLTLIGVIIAVVAFSTSGVSPLHDGILDSGGWTTLGEITSVEQIRGGERSLWRVQYRFEVKDSGPLEGTSYADRRLNPGDPCTVEYIRGQPEINRAQGTRTTDMDPSVSSTYGGLLVLGLLLTFLWFRSVLRLRIALREGRLTEAQIIETRILRFVHPTPVRVQYRFQDNLGQEHIAAHCVRASSTMGRQLIADSPRTHPVIHDEGTPEINRLVTAADFASGAIREEARVHGE